MFDLVYFDLGFRIMAKVSILVRRLGQGRSRFFDGHEEEDSWNEEQDHWGYKGAWAAAMARKAEAKALRKTEKLPLAIRFLENPMSVHCQSDCLLFSKLPPELREIIWGFALTRYEIPGTWYPVKAPHARPGQAARLRVAVELLLTCRAVYVEAFLVPFRVNPMIVYDGHPDVVPRYNVMHCTPYNTIRCESLRPWQFANVTSVFINAQQYSLEDGSLKRAASIAGSELRHQGLMPTGFGICESKFRPYKEPMPEPFDEVLDPRTAEDRSTLVRRIFMGKKITHLTLQLSRTDWWTWASPPQDDPHERLRLEPMINITERRDTSSAMEQGYEARKEGRQPEFILTDYEKQCRWGTHIAESWPDLQRLELVLEMFDIKEDQLDSVIRCAKLWTFPMGDDKWLEWDGAEESVVRWRGAHRYDYDEALGIEWVNDPVPARETRKDNTPLLRWRPDGEGGFDDGHGAGQEFVMKSLIFTLRYSPKDNTVV